MPAEYTCDVCGKPAAPAGYDGDILCTYHAAGRELDYEEQEYRKKREWVRNIWFKDLQERRAKIAELKRIVEENKP